MLAVRRMVPCAARHVCMPLSRCAPLVGQPRSGFAFAIRPLALPVAPTWAVQRRAIRVGGSKPRTQVAVEERPVEEQQQQQQTAALQEQQQSQPAWQSSGTTAAKVLEGDVGLQRFLQRTAMQTAAGLAITAASATACIVGVLPLFMGKTMLVPALVGIGMLIGASMIRPTIVRDELGHLASQNSALRQVLANGFFFLQGMMLAPLLAMTSPSVIVAAGLATVGIAAGMMAFSLSKPQGALLSWGGPLMVGMFGLLFCSIGGMLMGGAAASSMFWVTSIGSLGIFSAFVAYDIQSAIQQYKEGFPDHLGHAINMYLNLLNIFRSLLVLLGMMDD